MYQEINANKRKSLFLISIFILVIAALGYFAGWYLNLGYGPLTIAVIISLIFSLVSFYSGDKIALAMSGAKEIQAQDNPYVWRLIENLTITAGLPIPRVYIINDSALNAFATGRDPQHASIALTSGLIEALENEELEGVIAHELSHIKNYDIRVMMVAIICVGAITLLSDWIMRNMMWGRRSRSDRDNTGGILIIVGIILAILTPLIAKLLQLAVSRRREFLADASGALLTRYPEGLAKALEKIGRSQPLQHVNQATAHLYISEPGLDATEAGEKKSGRWSKLFSTHPPLAERIAKLRTMTR